jgi:hypothetical protein
MICFLSLCLPEAGILHRCREGARLQWGRPRANRVCRAVHIERRLHLLRHVAENGEDLVLPSLFHLSAQGNAVPGRAIIGYRVLIDNRLVYQNKFPVPLQHLSIETNLNAPFPPGPHTLQLLILVSLNAFKIAG